MGNIHPIFAQTDNLKLVHKKFIENLEQMNTYFKEYCSVTTQIWCNTETHSFQSKLDHFKKFDIKNASDQDLIQEMSEMAHFCNQKSDLSLKIWVE